MQSFAEKARQEHQLERLREAAQMRAGLAFIPIGAFLGLLRTFPATHAVVLHAPVVLLNAMQKKKKRLDHLNSVFATRDAELTNARFVAGWIL